MKQSLRERGKPVFHTQRPGYQETTFVEDLKITIADIEALAENCTQVLVWHTKTMKSSIGDFSPKLYADVLRGTNIEVLAKNLPDVSLKRREGVSLKDFGLWDADGLKKRSGKN